MKPKSEQRVIKMQELGHIVFRNIFLLTNGIIFSVVALLFIFKNTEAALFLGFVSILNIILGLIQDINAWQALRRLQLLTAPRVIRLNTDGTEEVVLTEYIEKGDQIKLKIGDQVPCDSEIVESHALEINEGLITGESHSVPRNTGNKILAGSIVTSGSGLIRAEHIYRESRIARMTEGIKQFSVSTSPIQSAVAKIITYSGYILVLVISIVIIRGLAVDEPAVRIVLNIGALASMIVPQGLVFATTLFFAYGAANLFRKHVLLQEINATEKLGRIKNLCMDKTGTLTENTVAVEAILLPPHAGTSTTARKEAEKDMAAYIEGSGESSVIIEAIKKYLTETFDGKIIEAMAFSSWRQYGSVSIEGGTETYNVLVGSPDIFLQSIFPESDRAWLKDRVDESSKKGKHVVCLVKAHGKTIPQNIAETKLTVIGIFIFFNNLREGIQDTIAFFQDRGVTIRIISGDNPETVQSVAAASGIKDTDKVITGTELESWTEADFETNIHHYTLFARILPEQKERIVAAFRKDGFTAMVGDGANDALAIKKADLGIAMFDGAPATRQLASVVLTTNSFLALPGGVELADKIIRNIEVFASIFLNQTFFGFLIFIFISAVGGAYPLTPLNITIINYFTIGIPWLLISYWTLRPAKHVKKASDIPFLRRIMPFSLWSAVIQSIGVWLIYLISPPYLLEAESNTLVLIGFIIMGFSFFCLAQRVYRGRLFWFEKVELVLLALIETALLIIAFHIPLAIAFFNLTYLDIPLEIIIKNHSLSKEESGFLKYRLRSLNVHCIHSLIRLFNVKGDDVILSEFVETNANKRVHVKE
jgi:cation-transporting ATPase E